jgi:hypothetical protein
MSIDVVLNALDNVRKVGADKWRAACPVHNGKDRNLLVSERGDGSVGAHCFVCGATGPDVVQSLGVNIKEIFAPDSDYKAPMISKKMLNEEQQDRLVLAMAEKMPPQTLADRRRVQLAQSRLEGIQMIRERSK